MPARSWRVEPAAVRALTSSARSDAEDVRAGLASIGAAISEAVAVLGATSSAGALAALAADPFDVEVRATAEHIENAANGVDTAVAAYDEGDAAMSAEIRAAQAGAPFGRASVL